MGIRCSAAYFLPALTLMTLPFIASIVLVLILISAAILWSRLASLSDHYDAVHRLGRALSLEAVNDGSRHLPAWYVGEHNDHAFGIACVKLKHRKRSMEEYGTKTELALRIAVGVQVPQPTGMVVRRDYTLGRAHSGGSFDASFHHRSIDALSAEGKEALLAFARQFGNIHFRDRERFTLSPMLIVQQALPDEKMILLHESPGCTHEGADVEQLLFAMVKLARELGQSLAMRPV